MATVEATLASPGPIAAGAAGGPHPGYAVNNRAGAGTHFGCGEVVNLGVLVKPAAANVATFGGIQWKFKSTPAGTTLGAVVAAAGTARLTIGVIPGTIELEAWGVAPAHNKPLHKITLKALAPNDLRFTQVNASTVRHALNTADAGFIADVEIMPSGVNFCNLEVREDEFKSVASGGFAHYHNRTHPAWVAWAPVVYVAATGKNKMQDPGDAIYSGAAVARTEPDGTPRLDGQGRPVFEAGTFEWNIPWKYRLRGGVGAGTQFAYAVHKQTLTEAGRVTIQKHNSTVYGANYGDPTQTYNGPAAWGAAYA